MCCKTNSGSMPESGNALVIPALVDPRRGWLVIWLQVGGLFRFRTSLTFLPGSKLSQELVQFLGPFGLLTPLGPGTYRLKELAIGGGGVPDLDVGVSIHVARAHVDGMLGMDFLARFSEIRLELPSGLLTLLDP